MHELFDGLNAPDDFVSVTGSDVLIVDEATGDSLLSRAQQYCKRLGLTTRDEVGNGHVFVNGRYLPVSDVGCTIQAVGSALTVVFLFHFLQNVMRQIATEGNAQLQILQEMVVYSDSLPVQF